MKIFWFKRLADGEHLPFDNEMQAARLFLRSDFARKFEYVGWSDGTAYNEAMKGVKKYTGEEYKEIFLHEGEQSPEKGQTRVSALERELQAAIDNPDKTRPTYHKAVNPSGGPLTDPRLARRFG